MRFQTTGNFNARGQAVIETALALPVLGVAIFMTLQLIFFCHNMIELQRAAMVAADRVSDDSDGSDLRYHWLNSLEGRIRVPTVEYTRAAAGGWHAPRGIAHSTVRQAATIVTVRVSTDLWPGSGFARVFPSVSQQAFAQTLVDAPAPKDQ